MGSPPDCAIGIMAKVPRPGYAKTRLCPPLEPDQAAALSAAFLRDISENIALAARQAPIAGYVAYAPEGQEALFDGHLAAGTGLLLADGSPPVPPGVQGFGRCLLHAIAAMLARGHGSAVVLNSDSPTLPTALLVRIAVALAADGDRVVLGPADDGGYYLLGMKAAHAHLFADIAWSTDSVARTTRMRAARLGLDVVELPAWYDVDDQVGLNRLLDEIAGAGGQRWDGPGSFNTIIPGNTVIPGLDPGIPAKNGGPGDPRVKPGDDVEASAHVRPPAAGSGLRPYPAPFTARALARMGLRSPGLDLAAE